MFGTYKSVKEYSLTVSEPVDRGDSISPSRPCPTAGCHSPAGLREPKIEGTPSELEDSPSPSPPCDLSPCNDLRCGTSLAIRAAAVYPFP
jgi:hypothetical protein